MKHCEKCRFEKHLHIFSIKKVGFAGVILMGLHLAFHVVELLFLPSVLIAFGGHAIEQPAMATTSIEDYAEVTFSTNDDLTSAKCMQDNIIIDVLNNDSYALMTPLCTLPLQY